MSQNDSRVLKKQNAGLKRALWEMVEGAENFLAALDKLMSMEVKPKERGRHIAKLANYLNHEIDSVRYFVLGVDYRTDKGLSKRISKNRLAKTVGFQDDLDWANEEIERLRQSSQPTEEGKADEHN